MPRSIKMIAMTAALLLVVGVAPAYADEDTTDTTEAPEIEGVESDEESEGSHINGKTLVLFGRGFDFSKGSALGELIEEFGDTGDGTFDWGAFDEWIAAGFDSWTLAGEPSDDPLALFGSLSQEQSEVIANFAANPPKNFGAFVSALRKHHGRNENSPVYAAAEDGETKKGKKSDNAGTDGDDGDDGDTFDAEDGGDEFSGKGKKSDHPGNGKKAGRSNKGGKKNNG